MFSNDYGADVSNYEVKIIVVMKMFLQMSHSKTEVMPHCTLTNVAKLNWESHLKYVFGRLFINPPVTYHEC